MHSGPWPWPKRREKLKMYFYGFDDEHINGWSLTSKSSLRHFDPEKIVRQLAEAWCAKPGRGVSFTLSPEALKEMERVAKIGSSPFIDALKREMEKDDQLWQLEYNRWLLFGGPFPTRF